MADKKKVLEARKHSRRLVTVPANTIEARKLTAMLSSLTVEQRRSERKFQSVAAKFEDRLDTLLGTKNTLLNTNNASKINSCRYSKLGVRQVRSVSDSRSSSRQNQYQSFISKSTMIPRGDGFPYFPFDYRHYLPDLTVGSQTSSKRHHRRNSVNASLSTCHLARQVANEGRCETAVSYYAGQTTNDNDEPDADNHANQSKDNCSELSELYLSQGCQIQDSCGAKDNCRMCQECERETEQRRCGFTRPGTQGKTLASISAFLQLLTSVGDAYDNGNTSNNLLRRPIGFTHKLTTHCHRPALLNSAKLFQVRFPSPSQSFAIVFTSHCPPCPPLYSSTLHHLPPPHSPSPRSTILNIL